MHPDLSPYLDAFVATASPAALSWPGAGALREGRRHELAEAVASRMNDPERAAAYAASCPTPGAAPDDYRLRELDLGSDGRLLAGVHFYRLEDRPFVGVLAMDRPLEDAAHLRRLHRALAERFAVFRPRASWWWIPAGAGLDLEAMPEASPDQVLLAGALGALQALPPPRGDERITAHAPGEGWYPWYEGVLRRLFEERPHLAAYLDVEPEEDLQDCEREGALLELRADGQRAGLVAAARARKQGLEGYVIWEEVLDTPWRGEGLGAAAQRRLVEALPAEGLLLGTIDAANTPSLRTALRSGRQEIGRWWFVGGRP